MSNSLHSQSVATFNGRHNSVKSKALLCLFSLDRPVGLSELTNYTGCNYYSLATLLTRWCEWQYVLAYGFRGSYTYKIAARGKRFLQLLADIRPDKLDIYKRELRQVRSRSLTIP